LSFVQIREDMVDKTDPLISHDFARQFMLLAYEELVGSLQGVKLILVDCASSSLR
jgi:hypothetical protein